MEDYGNKMLKIIEGVEEGLQTQGYLCWIGSASLQRWGRSGGGLLTFYIPHSLTHMPICALGLILQGIRV